MRGERLKTANKIAKKVSDNYGGQTIPVGRFRKVKVFCSNPFCCGNPRKIGDITIKEKAANDEYEDQLKEI